MKRWHVITICAAVALVLLPVLKDTVVKIIIEKGVQAVTGLKLDIRSLNAGIFKSAVSIKGLKVFNPPQFKDRVMVDMPEIYVDYDLGAIFGGEVHLKNLRINLKKFTVVKNAGGELNLNSLKVVQAGRKGAAPESKGGNAPRVRIDSLELKIGKAFYKDYTAPGGPSIREFNVNLDERYTNITNPYAVVSIIVVKALANTSIAGLANFDISGLRSMVMNTLLDAARSAPAAVKNTRETMEKAAGAIGDIFKSAVRSDSN